MAVDISQGRISLKSYGPCRWDAWDSAALLDRVSGGPRPVQANLRLQALSTLNPTLGRSLVVILKR